MLIWLYKYIWRWYAMKFDIDMPWHLTFDIWHLTLICHDIWHAMTFDIDMPWHLTWLKVRTALALILMILAQSHFHWWILRLSAIQKTDWENNIGLRDASAYKNCPQSEVVEIFATFVTKRTILAFLRQRCNVFRFLCTTLHWGYIPFSTFPPHNILLWKCVHINV